MGVEIWSVNYPIDVVIIFGSPSISKIDILGDLHAKFHDFCSKCTIVSQYYYTKRVDKNFELILKAKYKKNDQIGHFKKIPITKAIIDADS